MAIVKKSFLSNIIGENTYYDFKGYAKTIVTIGTCVLLFLFILSIFVHWDFISSLMDLVTGTSLLFIVYIVALILVLDIQVEVNEPERDYWDQEEKSPKSNEYKLTIAWVVVLIALGIAAMYFSNKYRKQYAFECETFLVDKSSGIYHLKFNHCEVAGETDNLEKMKGYEIGECDYTFCDCCEEWLEDVVTDYESNIYFRR